ncbi:hypothetical protein H5410_049824 [Solanum commersonii]|uniref:Uncharacterized protein n=1 Tax=Solanum commersonii TaxID=4109 RepID=A0A9J5WVA1_SOLCO|nr:hypothetical protein H5410_049824 [Solanum commersonii]
MKKSSIFVASITAGAISSSKVRLSHHQDESSSKKKKMEEENSSKKMGESKSSSDKFAPKFDGLRFIETLVTAHR